MLGTFSGLQAHRASASVFHLGASVGESQYADAVMGTRWQHVPVLKELSKIHSPVPVTPSLWSQLLLQGAGSGDGRPLCLLQVEWFSALVQDGNGVSSLLLGRTLGGLQGVVLSPCPRWEWGLIFTVGWSPRGLQLPFDWL